MGKIKSEIAAINGPTI